MISTNRDVITASRDSLRCSFTQGPRLVPLVELLVVSA